MGAPKFFGELRLYLKRAGKGGHSHGRKKVRWRITFSSVGHFFYIYPLDFLRPPVDLAKRHTGGYETTLFWSSQKSIPSERVGQTLIQTILSISPSGSTTTPQLPPEHPIQDANSFSEISSTIDSALENCLDESYSIFHWRFSVFYLIFCISIIWFWTYFQYFCIFYVHFRCTVCGIDLFSIDFTFVNSVHSPNLYICIFQTSIVHFIIYFCPSFCLWCIL